MPASVRTLSQLPSITAEQLCNKAKLEVSVPVEVPIVNGQPVLKYASRSITAGNLSKKIEGNVRENLINENGLPAGLNVSDLSTAISTIAYEDFTFNGEKTFLKDPTIDNSPLSSFSDDSSLNKYSVNYETLKKFTNMNASPSIGPNFGFVTRLSGTNQTSALQNIFKPKQENGQWTFSPEPYWVFNTNVKNLAANQYIFKIDPGERESKTWKAPASGIFTCYGWLDEMNNPSQSNESRWVALMGKEELLKENGWAILQVQPFIKNNYLSYVGFTFPVKKGMELKIVTGFAVGSNSNKYFASNSSIANNVGNAFLGGVYTGLSAFNEGTGDNYSTGPLDNDYVTSALLKNYVTVQHESDCELSTSRLIDELSTKMENSVNKGLIDQMSAAVDKKVNYIDTFSSKYSGTPRRAILYMYNAMFNWEAGEDEKYKQQCFDAHGNYTDSAPLLYCTVNDIRQNSVRSYYAPPTKTQDLDGGRTGYIERAYTRGDGLPYGRVFSDGKFMFYCVSQDCTAIVRAHPDYTPFAQSGIAAYMLCPRA